MKHELLGWALRMQSKTTSSRIRGELGVQKELNPRGYPLCRCQQGQAGQVKSAKTIFHFVVGAPDGDDTFLPMGEPQAQHCLQPYPLPQGRYERQWTRRGHRPLRPGGG